MARHDLAAHVHHEDDDSQFRASERRTRWVVGLTAVMMFGELIVGHLTGSVALKADGAHMGTHVLALGLTLTAYWYARTRANRDSFSFGTGKVYSLAGFTSGIVLAMVALYMVYEGIDVLATHPVVDFRDALPVAVLGLIVNGVSALMLGHGHHGHGHDHHGHDHHGHDHHGHDHHDHAAEPGSEDDRVKAGTIDFNLRAAYIHILADAMTSVLAIVALTCGRFVPALWFLDPLMGFVGAAVILWWVLSLCRQAARQLLDVVSSPAHEAVVRAKLEAIDDVRVADLHVWELGPGRRSCIVSIVTAHPRELTYYREVVLAALEVAHLTIEIHACSLVHADCAEPAAAAPTAPVPHAHAHSHAH